MTEELRKIPTHEVTYARLRDLILFGTLAPGQPVTIQGLVQDLQAGMTPVREALRRLTAEGALLPMGNRRVTVPQMSVNTLDQLAFARLSIEPRIAELSMPHLTPKILELLVQIDMQVNRAINDRDIPAYLQANHAFHFALYEASGATVLIDMVRSLWLQFGPSMRVICARGMVLGLPDQHMMALNAIRDRDPAALAEAIRQDISQGVNDVRAALERGEI